LSSSYINIAIKFNNITRNKFLSLSVSDNIKEARENFNPRSKIEDDFINSSINKTNYLSY